MPNTIELLETIGTDASLRHAAGNDLARALAGMHASEGLQLAAATGERTPLEAELGHRDMQSANSPIQTGTEGDEGQEQEPQRAPEDEPESAD